MGIGSGVDFTPRKLFASCFLALARDSWKDTAGSSRTNSRRRWGKRPFSKLAVVKTDHACSKGDIPAGAKRRASAIRRDRALVTLRA